jgi:hypothetical protein
VVYIQRESKCPCRSGSEHRAPTIEKCVSE